MESEFEKKLQRVKPRGLTPDEKVAMWSTIQETIKAESFIQAHKRSVRFNLFTGKRLKYFVAAILTGTLLAGSFGTVAFADNSRPGDLLFGVDLAAENIRLRLASPENQDELRIQFASERLEEVKELLALANIDFEQLPAEATEKISMATAIPESATTTEEAATSTEDTTDDSTSTSTDDTADTNDDTTDEGTTDESDDTAEEDTDDTTDSDESSDEVEEESDTESVEADTHMQVHNTNTNVNTAALERANNAFLIALEYLEDSRDSLLADGNDVAIVAIDAFIEELTVLADNHVGDIEKARIVVGNGPNNTERVNIAIKSSVDDVKTEFNFREITKENGDTTHKVALQSGNSEIKLKVNEDRTVYDIDNTVESDKDDDDETPHIRICYKSNNEDVHYSDLSHYLKKGAKLGECSDNDDKKVKLCHDGKTISVSVYAKQAHLNHGDTLGACEDDDKEDRFYICYKGDTKYVTWNEKGEYLNKGATHGKCSNDNGDVVKVPSCELYNGDDDRIVIDFNGQGIRSDQSKSASYTSHKHVDIDEGLYKVTLMSYDGYVGRENKSQPNESWHLVLWNDDNETIGTTGSVSDIPDYVRQETVIEVVNESFEIDEEVDEVYAQHSAYKDTSSANSVKVICAAFDELDDDRDTTAPVITEIEVEVEDDTADVAWDTNEPATSKVWYGTDNALIPGGSTAFVSSGGLVTDHLLTINGLTPETTYFYIVESTDEEGNTKTTERDSFITDAAPEPIDDVPPLFDLIVVNATTTEAIVAWTTDEDTTGVVHYSTSSPVTDADQNVESTTLQTSHSETITGLTPDTTYYYIIIATDEAGNIRQAAEDSFVTVALPDPVDTTPPIVSNVEATTTTEMATISFMTDEEASGTIHYSEVSPVPLGSNNVSFPAGTSHSVDITGLDAETTYYFIITAEDGSGNEVMEAEDSFTTLTPVDETAPVVSEVLSSLDGTTATITWSTDEDATGSVWYSTSSPVTAELGEFVLQNVLGIAHSVDLLALAASSTYYYHVVAHDEAGNSATSTEFSFITP